MVALRVSRRARRIGYGIAVGAGIALAPIAAGAASADTGPAAEGPATTAVQRVKPVVVPKSAVVQPAGTPVRKPAGKPVAAQRAVAQPGGAPASAVPHTGKAAVPQAGKAAVPQAGKAAVPQAGKAAVRPATTRAASAVARPVSGEIRGGTSDRRPVVVIGASVSSGKAVAATQAYPSRVAALSGRPVRVSSRVGAGYADGSMARLTRAANLPAQNPDLVVLQAGTNDVGAPPALIAGQVRQVVATVRQQAPGARIAVVTVFPSIHRGAAARSTDAAIISAARSVDPGVAVISPLNEGWTYGAADDGHPGAGAHLRIAERVAGLV
ncbi:SGNH/GDSL hydrolase family protein [Tsukamurella paurometabola]|uniref:SGNH hydrolase-type esterase domain-containing protein n=1 Tax=Tsukamurella paurometabola TaxID=2061 RepID=A0A3P8MAA7_TSUPA|nr:SGNH/GDSL hydrolase family protein [Tsukamurella paurometabola]MBS4103225.1 hypothetical protein [Tsukamurella paurometabola]UEA85370.1 GDSL-type esterase/lipase family protein [Tsukamurella paurometabola]VDR37990.1 Uncharacterised protein [Tsukamurella paurometabola]